MAGVRHRRCGRGHHEYHDRLPLKWQVLRGQGEVRGRNHAAPSTPRLVAEAAGGNLNWIAVTEAQRRSIRDGGGAEPRPWRELRLALRDASDREGRPAELMLPVRGSCSPRARRRSPRPSSTRTPTPSGPAGRVRATSTSVPTIRYSIYLPFFHVNAQSWSLLSVLGVGGTTVLTGPAVIEPVLGRGGRPRDHPHLADAVLYGPRWARPTAPKTKTLRVGVFGLIMPDASTRWFGIAVYAAYGMTETVTIAITGKPAEQWPARCRWVM